MLKNIALITLLFVAPASVFAQATTPIKKMPSGTYTLDKSHASVTWKVSHLGLSDYTARFTRMEATLDLNAEDPTQSILTAMVDPMSIETDYPNKEEKDFNAKLAKGEDWFNAEKFPEIKFVSTKIEKTGDNTGKIHGDLTFLGVTKPLTLDVTFNGAYEKAPFSERPKLGFSATATLKRSDWGMVQYVPNIGDEVTILIETEFDKTE